jgi:hypothetical protein
MLSEEECVAEFMKRSTKRTGTRGKEQAHVMGAFEGRMPGG